MTERVKGRESSHTWGTWARYEVWSSVLDVRHGRPSRWNTPSRDGTRTWLWHGVRPPRARTSMPSLLRVLSH
jgi:hypothetical protein